ncbi:MAG: SemiSWEET family transporter [Patescibacteria group bacterium]
MDTSEVFVVVSTILLYLVGFSAQVWKNYRDPKSTEAIHPLLYFLGACSLVSMGVYGWIHQNNVLLWSAVPGIGLGSIIIFQFFHYKLKKRQIMKNLMLQNLRGRVPRPTIHESS